MSEVVIVVVIVAWEESSASRFGVSNIAVFSR